MNGHVTLPKSPELETLFDSVSCHTQVIPFGWVITVYRGFNQYFIILLLWGFFTAVLSDGLSQEFNSKFPGLFSLSRSILDYYYYYYSPIRAFHISVSRWFFTGVWVTASLLKSPGLFLVFWPFSIML